MTNVYRIAAIVSTLATIPACGSDVAQPDQHGPCGPWSPDTQDPGKACEEDADCGDPGVCVHPACVGGACAYEPAPVGMQCAQCNVYGSCDGSGACVALSQIDTHQPCAGGPAYVLDELEGSCSRLWCVDGTAKLVDKPDGVPCVVNLDGQATFYQGQCYPGGECR